MSESAQPHDRTLSIGELDPDPIVQFRTWFAEAGEVNPMPEAMALATVDGAGRPDVRMVLMKGAGPDGFTFFSHYNGVKAGQMDANPGVALAFHWPELDRQVRVRGTVSHLSAEKSDAYFASRDRNSQIGAWASPQSRELEPDRAAFDRLIEAAEERFRDQDVIPRPPHWGGHLVAPDEIEFWQGRQARWHDRFRYFRDGEAGWAIHRLAP